MHWLGIILLATLLAFAPGYAGAQQKPGTKGTPAAAQPQASQVKGEQPGTPTSFTPEEKQAYLKKTTKELDELQKKIYDLRIKATTGSPQLRRMILRSSSRLQIQAVTARNQLKALEEAPRPAWSEKKTELDRTMEDLRKSWAATKAHIHE